MCRNLNSEARHASEDPTQKPPRRITPETRRRFTGPRRKLNGASPDLVGSKRLPKLTTSSPLLVFTGEHHRRASIEQIEISFVTSSHQTQNQAESPLKNPETEPPSNERIVRCGEGAGKKDAKRVTFSRKQSRRSLLKDPRLPRGKTQKDN
ncbi:hypothetical protein F2Q68_00017526 [Brassica cretica]|uniref:Uncharacterized protein n=1 Tax=Brassica cretica TaxID=69181 RepID=A0A8S9HLD3_BRACR|nr:hypothetical protein F2Q68_00017526 [Brassica cretica]